MNTTTTADDMVVTVGRGHDTHRIRPTDPARTVCGRAWTDEHPPETRVTCRTCRIDR